MTSEVGGKNASLGELISYLKEDGIQVPPGFCTTSAAYRAFIEHNNIASKISSATKNISSKSLAQVGNEIRQCFYQGTFPESLSFQITEAYKSLAPRTQATSVAVRSSATAEDLPEASFAGQQESFLNVHGAEALLEACKNCFASLFTDRALAYREKLKFDHLAVSISVGIQKMVRSDKACSGVIFSIDPESGYRDVVVINSAWGLGEAVVSGKVDPDEYVVFKPLLNDKYIPIIERKCGKKQLKTVYSENGQGSVKNISTSPKEQAAFTLSEPEILRLARWAVKIEQHYNTPMDIEWAKDGNDKNIYILQARPETVHSRNLGSIYTSYELEETSAELASGIAIGSGIGSGRARVIRSPEQAADFKAGEILVTEMTDPDWGPVMQRAAAIVTDHGGRTAHAAIVSRELGIPAIVGTGNATTVVPDGSDVTVSCANGEKGVVMQGKLKIARHDIDLNELHKKTVHIMMNLASPQAAFKWHAVPSDGVGLARIEFIIANEIKIHPLALYHFSSISDQKIVTQIENLTSHYRDKTEYYIQQLSRGIAKIAAPHYPQPVFVRTSDFKSNEYRRLIGGELFEELEANPMLGFRGASRYYSKEFSPAFSLECQAIKRAREVIGLKNIHVMIPFCRTPAEAKKVLEIMKDQGLERGKDQLQIYVMAEIPSNIILAEQFAELFDGFSIGSNDLTQLTLGVDRDSSRLATLFSEQDPAVKSSIKALITAAHKKNRKVGICGEGPATSADFASFLVEAGIDSISMNPASVITALRDESWGRQ